MPIRSASLSASRGFAGALTALDLEIQFNGGQAPPNMSHFEFTWLTSMGPLGFAGFAFLVGILGVVTLYILGFLCRWSGGVLGGTATAVEVRAALAWAHAPRIYASILGVLIAILSTKAPAGQLGTPLAFGAWWSLAFFVLHFWGLVIFTKTLGEVHRFSAWRGLTAMILGSFAGGAVLLLGIAAVTLVRGLV